MKYRDVITETELRDTAIVFVGRVFMRHMQANHNADFEACDDPYCRAAWPIEHDLRLFQTDSILALGQGVEVTHVPD